MEGCTDVLRHASAFEWWCSGFANDSVFGSLGSFVGSDLAGKNTFAFPDPRQFTEVADVIGRSVNLVESSRPTRVLLLIPSEAKHKFLTIARVAEAPTLKRNRCDLTLALAINKESMLRDPINWPSLSARLKEWSPLLD